MATVTEQSALINLPDSPVASARTRSRCAWILPPALMLLLSVVLFSNGGYDDPFISYFPAWTLAHGHGMLNYSGNRVEMSSSLLWVLILALATKITTLPLPTISPVLSTVFGLLAVALSQSTAHRLHPGAGMIAGFLAATCLPLTYWATGGMETTLAACLWLWVASSWAGVLQGKSVLYCIIPTAGMLLVRPESPICLGCLLVALAILDQRRATRQVLYLGAVTVIMIAAMVTFRVTYFGDIAPQPVTAKMTSFSLERLIEGFSYGLKQAQQAFVWPLLLFAVASAIYSWRIKQLPVVLVGLSALIYCAFAVTSGGDWMDASRFLAPAFPALCILAGIALQRSRFPLAGTLAVGGVQIAACIVFALTAQHGMTINETMTNYSRPYTTSFGWFDCGARTHLRDMEYVRSLTRTLRSVAQTKRNPVTIVSGQMGMLMFDSITRAGTPVYVTDVCGLQDRTISSLPEARYAPRNPSGIVTGDSIYWNRVQSGFIAPPDIVALFNPTTLSQTQQTEYTPVFVQHGDLYSAGLRNGVNLNCGMMLLVRNDIYRKARLHPEHFDWPSGYLSSKNPSTST